MHMKINKSDIPVRLEAPGMIMRSLEGYGGMTIAYNELPAGTDFTPLLKGLDNDSCHCPHWGYVVEGAIRIVYDDGTEEVTRGGDVYYWPNGHTAVVEEDLKFIEFSPSEEFAEVIGHCFEMMEKMG